jgi:hypothetical protein
VLLATDRKLPALAGAQREAAEHAAAQPRPGRRRQRWQATIRWDAEGPAALRHSNPAAIAAAAGYAILVAVSVARSTSPSRVHDRNERELAAGWDALATAWNFNAAVEAYERTPAASSLTL